jgi:hypothetical protein
MAIGSEPEIGVQFTTWGKMDETARAAWFKYIREHWYPDLMKGYATLVTTRVYNQQFPTQKEDDHEQIHLHEG